MRSTIDSLSNALRVTICVIMIGGCRMQPELAEESKLHSVVPNLSAHTPDAASTWMKAWADNQMDIIARQYAEDAIMYPNGLDPVVGLDSIQSLLVERRMNARLWSIQSLESESDGGVGFETGHFLSEDSAGAVIEHGSYMTVWKFSNGRWRIYRQIWNGSSD